MMADMISNKPLNQIVSELNISTAFIIRSYFAVPKDVRPNCAIFRCKNSRQTRASTNPI